MLWISVHSTWGGKVLLFHSDDRRGWWITVWLFPWTMGTLDTYFSHHSLANFNIFLSSNHFHHFPVKQGKDKNTKRSSVSSLQLWNILEKVQDFILIISASRGRVSCINQAIIYSSLQPRNLGLIPCPTLTATAREFYPFFFLLWGIYFVRHFGRQVHPQNSFSNSFIQVITGKAKVFKND